VEVLRALHIGAQICRALAAAHTAGIIHRDLKPENVFLVAREGTADFVKVLDFGIAKSAEMEEQRKERLTHPGMAMGTPEYMSPEQAAGQPADTRSDVYAVGAILYEMLSGEPPYDGDNFMEILTKKATRDPVPLKELRPGVPDAVEKIVMRAMARAPSERQPSMEAFEYEITKCLAGRGVAVAKVLGMPIDPLLMQSGLSNLGGEQAVPEGSGSGPSSAWEVHRESEQVKQRLARKTMVGFAGLGLVVVVAAAGAYVSFGTRSTPDLPVAKPAPPEPPAAAPQAPPAPVEAPRGTAQAPSLPTGPLGRTQAKRDPKPELGSPGAKLGPVAKSPEPIAKAAHTAMAANAEKTTKLSPVGPPPGKKEAEALLAVARAEAAQSHWRDARAIFERVAHGKHLRAEGLLGIARVAFETKDTDLAIRYAEEALRAGGGDSARMLLGHVYFKKGRYDDAIEQYQAVLKRNPGNREAQVGLREAEKKKRGG
jgi:hypothetical protein